MISIRERIGLGLCLAYTVPFFYYLILALEGSLGAEPGKVLVDAFGETAMLLLVLVLWLRPVRYYFGLSVLVRYRRSLGLAVFFYAVLHALSYLAFVLGFSLSEFVQDISKRPYITLGMASLFILLLLALTSNKMSVQYLGRRWKSLHQFVYWVAILVIVHYLWQLKSMSVESVLYALLVLTPLLLRLSFYWGKQDG